MTLLKAQDIHCVADEAGAVDFEFESPSGKARVTVRSHDRLLAKARADEFFAGKVAEEQAEIFERLFH